MLQQVWSQVFMQSQFNAKDQIAYTKPCFLVFSFILVWFRGLILGSRGFIILDMTSETNAGIITTRMKKKREKRRIID